MMAVAEKNISSEGDPLHKSFAEVLVGAVKRNFVVLALGLQLLRAVGPGVGLTEFSLESHKASAVPKGTAASLAGYYIKNEGTKISFTTTTST